MQMKSGNCAIGNSRI